GEFIWPGFAENSRVLAWIVQRAAGDPAARATSSRLGLHPDQDGGGLDLTGLDLSAEDLAELLAVDPALWTHEAALIAEYFEKFGAALPSEMQRQLKTLQTRMASEVAG